MLPYECSAIKEKGVTAFIINGYALVVNIKSLVVIPQLQPAPRLDDADYQQVTALL